jgi:hypothetical protein
MKQEVPITLLLRYLLASEWKINPIKIQRPTTSVVCAGVHRRETYANVPITMKGKLLDLALLQPRKRYIT